MHERKYRQEHISETSESRDLVKLSDLHDWKIPEDQPDIRKWSVVDRDHEKAGTIDDLLVDTSSGEALYAIIGYGGALGIGEKKTLVPLDQVRLDRSHERLVLPHSVDMLKDAPNYTDDTRDYNSFHDFWSGKRTEEPTVERSRDRELRERRAMEARERGREIDKRLQEAEAAKEPGRSARMRVVKQEQEHIEGVEPGQPVVREGETVEIPVVGERTVVTGKVVIIPETVEEEEEEEQ